MSDYLISNPESFWFGLGFLLLCVEAFVMGLSTGILLFAGVGALITGGLIWGGVVSGALVPSLGSFALASTVVTLVLWKPFRMLQKGGQKLTDNRSSDFIGLTFRLEGEITPTRPGKHKYSGVTWRVEIAPECPSESLAAGAAVEVVSVDAGVFRVKPVA